MISGVFGGVRRLGILLVLFAHQGALTAPESGGDEGRSIVPVERASFHHLVFANDDVAVLNNSYPPGGDSGFHGHFRDLFYVVIQPGNTSGQRVGQPLSAAPETLAGAAGYSPVGAGPRVHRVVNGDKSAAQIIVVEIRRPSPLGEEASSRAGAPGYEQIVDNPRMRAWRLILAPGQSVPAISQGGNGVRIVVRGGLLTTMTSGGPDQTLLLKAGDFAVQSAGETRALRNGGAETFELVEMELK